MVKLLENRWSKPLRAWESELEEELHNIVAGINMRANKKSFQWKINDSSFSIKECYQLNKSLNNHVKGHWLKIWKVKVPPNVNLFL